MALPDSRLDELCRIASTTDRRYGQAPSVTLRSRWSHLRCGRRCPRRPPWAPVPARRHAL